MQIKHNNSLGFKFWDDESSINFQPSSFSTFLLFHMYKQLSLITLHAKFQLHRYAALWHPPLQFLPRLPRQRWPDSEIYYRNIVNVYIKRFLATLSSPSQKIGIQTNYLTRKMTHVQDGRILYFNYLQVWNFRPFHLLFFQHINVTEMCQMYLISTRKFIHMKESKNKGNSIFFR